jgi:hypothetical protein
MKENTNGQEMMEHVGFKARIMEAERLSGNTIHGLPPGTPMTVYPLEALPGAPEDWVRKAGSYVIPISTTKAMWFDWTMNDPLNTAVIPSVKGMNPITGKKLDDLALEQYIDKCPVHGKTFKDGLYCEECDYRWPSQNYVASPNILWLDGFRSADGQVRQFFFTEDEKRDIVSLVIGKENTVPAFGFAFYEPEKRREPPPGSPLRGCSGMTGGLTFGSNLKHYLPQYYSPLHTPQNWDFTTTDYYVSNSTTGGLVGSSETASKALFQSNLADEPKFLCSTTGERRKGREIVSQDCASHEDLDRDRRAHLERAKKDVSVGAGAIINQGLAQDPLACKDWKKEPSALIRLYFVFPEQFKAIVKSGIRDLNGKKDGFLAGMPVG